MTPEGVNHFVVGVEHVVACRYAEHPFVECPEPQVAFAVEECGSYVDRGYFREVEFACYREYSAVGFVEKLRAVAACSNQEFVGVLQRQQGVYRGVCQRFRPGHRCNL